MRRNGESPEFGVWNSCDLFLAGILASELWLQLLPPAARAHTHNKLGIHLSVAGHHLMFV